MSGVWVTEPDGPGRGAAHTVRLRPGHPPIPTGGRRMPGAAVSRGPWQHLDLAPALRRAPVGYLMSWTLSGAPANPGVESVGPWNTARRQTPLRFLPPGQPVIWNPEKPMMW